MSNTFDRIKKVIAAVLFFSIMVGMSVSLPATKTEAATKKSVSRMSFIKQVVKTMGLDYKNADSKAIDTYQKQFKTTATNAKYIAAAVDAGVITSKQWKSIKTKINYKEMYIALAKADEKMWGEWITDENAQYLKWEIENVREDTKLNLTDEEKTLLYKAYMLGYADRYRPTEKGEDYYAPLIRLSEKPDAKVVKTLVSQLKTPKEDWYKAYIPAIVELGDSTQATAFCNAHVGDDDLKIYNDKGEYIDLVGGSRYNLYGFVDVTAEWSSSNEKVLTVDNTGLMKGKKAGTATVTCTIRNTTFTQEVTVKKTETIDEYMISRGAREVTPFSAKHIETKDELTNNSFSPNKYLRALINRYEAVKVSASTLNNDSEFSKYNLKVADEKGYVWLYEKMAVQLAGADTSWLAIHSNIRFKFNCELVDGYTKTKIDTDAGHGTFSIKWNGKTWNNCEYYAFADFDESIKDARFFVKVPEGYDGLLCVFGNFDAIAASKTGSELLNNTQNYFHISAK